MEFARIKAKWSRQYMENDWLALLKPEDRHMGSSSCLCTGLNNLSEHLQEGTVGEVI